MTDKFWAIAGRVAFVFFAATVYFALVGIRDWQETKRAEEAAYHRELVDVTEKAVRQLTLWQYADLSKLSTEDSLRILNSRDSALVKYLTFKTLLEDESSE